RSRATAGYCLYRANVLAIVSRYVSSSSKCDVGACEPSRGEDTGSAVDSDGGTAASISASPGSARYPSALSASGGFECPPSTYAGGRSCCPITAPPIRAPSARTLELRESALGTAYSRRNASSVGGGLLDEPRGPDARSDIAPM